MSIPGIYTLDLTEAEARLLRKMVVHHLELVQGDGSLSDEEDDLLVGMNQMIRNKTEGL